MNIDFTPQETDWLNDQAKRQGLQPAEIIRRLVDESMPEKKEIQVVPAQTKPVLSAKSLAAIAFLEARIAEGLAADPETKRQAEEELEEFKRNMNANRAATGERLVYP